MGTALWGAFWLSAGIASGYGASGVVTVCQAAAETVRPGASDDFRAVYATSQEIAEGKRVADASCARCHGTTGISAAPGVPHVAGQRAVYLHLELRAYKSGKRGPGMMTDAAKFLSEDALIQVAAWYATQDPPQPAPAAATAHAGIAGPLEAGKAATAGCAGCHGETGISRVPGMPSLTGLDPGYLAAAMAAYRDGRRSHGMMKALVGGLSDTDLQTIANFYAMQKPGRAETPAAGDPARGKAAAKACAACHGETGISAGPTPSLAGQDAQYFAAAMKGYQDGSRDSPLMKGPASATADAVVTDIAAYFASLQPQPPKISRPPSMAEWAERCDRCHGVNGNSTDPRVPALAAQHADYLDRVLNAYRTGARKSPAMSAMARVLTESEIRQLAEHYARQKARSVVYVQLPAPRGN